MELLLFACVLAAAAGAAVGGHGSAADLNTTSKFLQVIRTGDSVVYYTPAVFYFSTVTVGGEGKREDIIKRCLVEDPENCEVFQEGHGANHILVHMEYVYLGSYHSIVKCESYRKQSCSYMHKTNAAVFWLNVVGEHLYAGLNNGSILVCNLQQPVSCRTLHTFTKRIVMSLQATDKLIYAGLNNGHLMQCSLTIENSCTLTHDMGTSITSLTILKNTIFAVSWNVQLWKCSEESGAIARCVSEALTSVPFPRAVVSFNGSLYISEYKEEKGLYICNWSSNLECRKYAHYKASFAFAFAYGTHHLQTRFKNEDTACTWQPDSLCPPYVTYYDVQQRSKFEVHVKNGKLYDAAGSLVDTTSEAEEEKQSRPAIFVMSPDGRILLKKSTDIKSFTSSLLAGSPVSGAGEMLVEQGVIKKMAACSPHYLPDLELNKQVVDSLRSQGYTEPIVSEKCQEIISNVQ